MVVLDDQNLRWIARRDGRIVPDGNIRWISSSGTVLLEGIFLVGRREGEWVRRYENGYRRSEHTYRAGRPVGSFRQWYANSQLAISGVYRAGRLHGNVRRWYPDGRLSAEMTYEAGRRVRMRQWLVSGHELVFDREKGFVGRYLQRPITSTKLCVVLDSGRVYCTTSLQFARRLGELVDPADVERLLGKVDDLYNELGLNPQKKLLVSCSGGWKAVPLGLAGRAETAATAQELEEMLAACRVGIAGKSDSEGPATPTSPHDPDQVRRDYVNQTIEQMDEAMEGCRDPHPLSPSKELTPIEKWYINKYGIPYRELGDWTHEHDQRFWQHQERTTNDIAAILIIQHLLVRYAEKKEEAAQEAAQEEADEAAREAAARAAEADRIDAEEERKEREQSGRASPEEEEEAGQCLPGSQCTEPAAPPPAPEGASDLGQPAPDGGSSCAGMRAWWALFKEYCSQSDWKEYRCEQMLRKLNQCVDMAEILPGPDGDVTCAARKTGTEARKKACEAKKGFMLPSGFGFDRCASPGDLMFVWGLDVCNDPVAMPHPDQCLGPDSIEEEPDGTVPTPRPIYFARFGEPQPTRPDHGGTSKVTALHSALTIEECGPGVKLVIFKAEGCAPCRILLEIMEDLAGDYTGTVHFYTVDVSQNRELARQYEILYTPTMIIFDGTEIVGQRRVGAASRDRLRRFLDNKLNEVSQNRESSQRQSAKASEEG
jgi:thioredoxin 1